MGYNREDIEYSISNQKYDEIFATYLLLGRKSPADVGSFSLFFTASSNCMCRLAPVLDSQVSDLMASDSAVLTQHLGLLWHWDFDILIDHLMLRALLSTCNKSSKAAFNLEPVLFPCLKCYKLSNAFIKGRKEKSGNEIGKHLLWCSAYAQLYFKPLPHFACQQLDGHQTAQWMLWDDFYGFHKCWGWGVKSGACCSLSKTFWATP